MVESSLSGPHFSVRGFSFGLWQSLREGPRAIRSAVRPVVRCSAIVGCAQIEKRGGKGAAD